MQSKNPSYNPEASFETVGTLDPVPPKKVHCTGWISFINMQWRVLWAHCDDPNSLYDINRYIAKRPYPNWSCAGQTLLHEITLHDSIQIYGIAIKLEAYHFQLYRRNKVSLLLESRNYKKQPLIDEILDIQQIISDDDSILTLILRCNQASCKRRHNELSIILRGESITMFHLLSMTILEHKPIKNSLQMM